MCCENGIPGGTISSPDAAGEMIAKECGYTPTALTNEVSKGTTQKDRARDVIEFFKSIIQPESAAVEIGIGVAGVWLAESGIKTWKYNSSEAKDGYAFKNKHAPDADTFNYKGKKYYKDQASMMQFGYGKGVAQWSWSRNFKFRDWYNSSQGVKTEGIPTMDENASGITGTSVTTQTAFAWKEMSERTGEFMDVINGIIEHPAESKDEYIIHIINVVDAVLRGFENGDKLKMASKKQIDKYTWSGGYSGSMKKRVSGALGVGEALKDEYPDILWYLINEDS